MKFVSDKFSIGNNVYSNVLVSCDHGLMIVNRFDTDHRGVGQGISILDHGNLCSVEAQLTFECIKNDNPIIFDIGSNIGAYSIWVTKAYPKGKVFCFEPQRVVFQMLGGNLAINNIFNAYTYNIAFGNEDKIIDIQEPNYKKQDSFGSFSLIKNKLNNKTENFSRIEMYKLDTFVNKIGINQIDFLKIDCEGMDLEVLKGGEETIKKFKPSILVEVNDETRDISSDVIKFLENFNYEFYKIELNLLAIPKKSI